MKRSTERMLTTHAGRLPNPDNMAVIQQARTDNDQATFDQLVQAGVADRVRKQIELRNDMHSDGEFWKARDAQYYNSRVTGVEMPPHTTDIPFQHIVDLMLKVNAQAYSVEAADVRHELDYQVREDVKFPDGKLYIPGVIAHKTTTIEPPRTRGAPPRTLCQHHGARERYRWHGLWGMATVSIQTSRGPR